MFVSENSVDACLLFMKNRLNEKFSDSEIRRIQAEAFEARLGFSRSDLLLRKRDGLSESDLLYFRDIVKRLLKNEPLQHIIGSTYFCDLKLKTDRRALIPRPETEELVHNIVMWVADKRKDSPTILDVCTGSGCIALALKHARPTAQVEAVDIDENALNLARENAVLTQLAVHVYQANALELSKDIAASKKWDVIVSNPPYIPTKDKQAMHKNVLEHEPHIALFVEDDDPLLFYREIAKYAVDALSHDGVLAVEIHEDLATQVVQLFTEFGFKKISVLKDLQEKNRMVFAEFS